MVVHMAKVRVGSSFWSSLHYGHALCGVRCPCKPGFEALNFPSTPFNWFIHNYDTCCICPICYRSSFHLMAHHHTLHWQLITSAFKLSHSHTAAPISVSMGFPKLYFQFQGEPMQLFHLAVYSQVLLLHQSFDPLITNENIVCVVYF